MSRFANYANLFDKVTRMVNSKMWAAPLWYQGARRAPPPIHLMWPKPPLIKLPELQLYKKVMERIPVLKLEKEFGGRNPFVGNERSIAWKFAKRQHQYISRLHMSEEEAFKKTEQDLDPEIHEMTSNLHKVPVEETTPYEFLKGTGLENDEMAQSKMRASSTLSVHSIRANIALAKAEATVARARKRKAGEVPTPQIITELMENRMSMKPNEPAPLDPLYGPPQLISKRIRMFNRQIDELGMESVQRRFMEKPSATHETLQSKLQTADGRGINNPTAEYLAAKILPEQHEVRAFREAIEQDEEAYENKLNAYTNEAAAVDLQELRLFRGMPLVDIALQADKLREFRALVLASESQVSDGLVEGQDLEHLQAFVQKWKDPKLQKERQLAIARELQALEGEEAESAWQKSKADAALLSLRRDVFGVDPTRYDSLSNVPTKYIGMLKELQSLSQSSERKNVQERMDRRKNIKS